MIPSETEIRRALLMELYDCSGHAATPDFCYNKLVEYFEQVLDDDDLAGPYHNSKNRWANTIQVTRNHMIAEGLILSRKQNKRNEWKLSQQGVSLGQELFIKAYGYDPWATQTLTLDNIPEAIVEQFQQIDEEITFPEGKIKYELHTRKERNKKLVALKKKLAYEINPLLPCEICGISLKQKYGKTGDGIIEAHHVFPISLLTEETKMKLEDLILVCPNCHRMIHHKRPWLTVEKIKLLLVEVPKK